MIALVIIARKRPKSNVINLANVLQSQGLEGFNPRRNMEGFAEWNHYLYNSTYRVIMRGAGCLEGRGQYSLCVVAFLPVSELAQPA